MIDLELRVALATQIISALKLLGISTTNQQTMFEHLVFFKVKWNGRLIHASIKSGDRDADRYYLKLIGDCLGPDLTEKCEIDLSDPSFDNEIATWIRKTLVDSGC